MSPRTSSGSTSTPPTSTGSSNTTGLLASRLGAAGVAPTTTMLGVARLAVPDLMVELEGTAVVTRPRDRS